MLAVPQDVVSSLVVGVGVAAERDRHDVAEAVCAGVIVAEHVAGNGPRQRAGDCADQIVFVVDDDGISRNRNRIEI